MSKWIFSLAYNVTISEIEDALAYSDRISADVRETITGDVELARYLKQGYAEYINNDDGYDTSYRMALELLRKARSRIPEDVANEVKFRRDNNRAIHDTKMDEEKKSFLEWSRSRSG